MFTIIPEQMGPRETDWQAESHADPEHVGLTSQSLILFLSKGGSSKERKDEEELGKARKCKRGRGKKRW